MTKLPSSPPAGGPELGADTMDLLRFATIGSVDDGKSTLIGRLLFDTRQLFDDQLDAINAASERRGLGEVDLSFVTDGLRAEREQGITIDVAYRYAATPHRKFVIADCPGHVQYTANMATGTSTADLVLALVDATSGLREQSRRHICIAALLGVDQLVVCANKMDLVDWDKSAYQGIVDEMQTLARRLGITHCTVIPISALLGDNVVERSDAAPWYDGPTVLDALESAQAGGWASQHGLRQGNGGRLPVQWVLRQPGGGRSYAGMVNGGPFRTGDPVVVLPQGLYTTVRSIETADGPLSRAEVGLSIAMKLNDEIDISRGDLISSLEEPPTVTDSFEATVCWFGERPLTTGDRLKLKHTTRVTPVVVESVEGIFDVNELEVNEATELVENDIGIVRLRTATPLAIDTYKVDRITGSFVLIDDLTIATVAAGMVGPPSLHR
ncbi:MAG TPA: GTP-binding protein [Acidimicrobiales bacterium]|jgi:sulfate adenylyltransferase large subunit|nr:GTP-binding protein [Acidimicrobiales bacterium]